jgi:ribulose-phosphate 3-epimerase
MRKAIEDPMPLKSAGKGLICWAQKIQKSHYPSWMAIFRSCRRNKERIESFQVDCIHLDIMDGNFVPQITFGQPFIRLLRKKTRLFMDAHLMIKNTDTCLDSFIACGADMITVHAESANDLHFCLKKIKENKMQSCVALKPATPLCFIEEVLDVIDSVIS